MVIDSLIVPETLVKPQSFAGLVTLYESNYLRLLSLFPGVAEFSDARVASIDDDLDLHIELIERSRYTVTFTLSYRFEDEELGAEVDEPGMKIRVYLDANLAEAMELSGSYVRRLLGPAAKNQYRELDCRWARNSMFNKWLEFLADRGYSI